MFSLLKLQRRRPLFFSGKSEKSDRSGQIDFMSRIGGVIDCLHHAGSEDDGIDMGGKLLAGADAADEGVDLVLEHIDAFIDRCFIAQLTVFDTVNREVPAVLQTDARLIA